MLNTSGSGVCAGVDCCAVAGAAHNTAIVSATDVGRMLRKRDKEPLISHISPDARLCSRFVFSRLGCRGRIESAGVSELSASSKLPVIDLSLRETIDVAC